MTSERKPSIMHKFPSFNKRNSSHYNRLQAQPWGKNTQNVLPYALVVNKRIMTASLVYDIYG
jgi:hypothetical protein